jgi:PIN domain nuclease of toxin-antitoxin system
VRVFADTHALIWWLDARRNLSRAQSRALAQVSETNPLLISDISLWEIATLFELGRIRLGVPLRDWLERATAAPLVQRVGMSPVVAAEVASLPSSFHRDPADRIIVASARVHGAKLVTSDRRIADAALVPTVQ